MSLLYNNDTQVANYVKKIDWKKVAVTAGAIGVGIALTVATGGLGAPVAMAIGGAASGAIMSGYDAYSSGQRGWALVGSIAKGAGLGAITGFVGGQFIGAGANVAANVTQNITNQTVRHVAKAGVEAGVETVIDTGISVATGNPITIKNVVTDYGLNLITNGSGSVSSKKSAKADVPKNKPKSGDVAVTKSRQSSTPVQQLSNPGPNQSRIPVEAVDGNGNKVYGEILEPGYIHTRPVKDITSTTSTAQKLLPGPDPKTLRLEAPKVGSSTNQNIDFNNWLNKGSSDNSVYYGINSNTGEAVYTGITKQGLDSRLSQHNRQGKNFLRLDEQHNTLTRNQAQSIEQYLIENGSANQLNKINSISPNNKMYGDAMQWAENYLNGGN
ncbi:hypothetical protein [Streptococcus suis]|uniref:hypothetical protein n=1 Tax=Streptococcus suis TaxID=1307 RepID=UPI0011462925|nr:hypothetical protein [Streptococcus suis]